MLCTTPIGQYRVTDGMAVDDDIVYRMFKSELALPSLLVDAVDELARAECCRRRRRTAQHTATARRRRHCVQHTACLYCNCRILSYIRSLSAGGGVAQW